MKLVPFNDRWMDYDLHAIYRRPRWTTDEYGELVRERDGDGVPAWDITTPLPVKSHDRWRAKGFEFVTLATVGDLARASRFGTLAGDAADYVMRDGAPWHWPTYARWADAERSGVLDELRADVQRFGATAVTMIRRRTDPNFQLPPGLEDVR